MTGYCPYFEYRRLLLELSKLRNEEYEDKKLHDAKIDSLLEKMDTVWYSASEKDQKNMRKYAAYWNMQEVQMFLDITRADRVRKDKQIMKNYKDCNLLEKIWRSRHLIRVPFIAIGGYLYERFIRKTNDIPFSFRSWWGIAHGIVDSKMGCFVTHDSLKDAFDYDE